MRELALKVTSHVGRDLLASAASFKTEQTVVWEYVVNALQYVDEGVVPKVHVQVFARDHRIEISDNGRGMSDADLRQFFTMHGENVDRLRGRPGRGKFGTGKSAAFGIGRVLEVDSRRNGLRNYVVLSRQMIDASSGKDIPLDWRIRNEATTLPNGTVIRIAEIQLTRLFTPNIIEYIERHLQFFRARRPEVAVNDHVCQYREPEILDSREFSPTPEQASLIGETTLRIKVSRAPLPEAEVGVAVTAGLGALVAIETGGIERKEFGNYLFGEIDCPALETHGGAIEPYDPSRNLQLNIHHPVCATLVPFIASKLELLRQEQVRKLQEARKTEQARRLESEASRIADILNRDFNAHATRLQGIQAAAASSPSEALAPTGAEKSAGDDPTAFVEGISERGDVPDSTNDNPGQKEQLPREAPQAERRGTSDPSGNSSVDPAGGQGKRRRPKGGFRVAYRNLGKNSYRSDYDRPTLTILINLDHPAICNALSAGGTEDVSFRRLSYELAFTEYSLALGWEMADRDPEMPADDLLFEIRACLNRVAVAAASLYAG